MKGLVGNFNKASLFLFFSIFLPLESTGLPSTTQPIYLVQNNHGDNLKLTPPPIPLERLLQLISKKWNIDIVYDPALVNSISVLESFLSLLDEKALSKVEYLKKVQVTLPNIILILYSDALIIKPVKTEDDLKSKDENMGQGYLFYVQDAQTKEPLINAYAELMGRNSIFTSNDQGFFYLPESDSLVKYLSVKMLGYDNRYIKLDTLKNKIHYILELNPEFTRLDDFVINAKKTEKLFDFSPHNRGIQISKSSYGGISNLGIKDFTKIIQMLPGISATSNGNMGMSLRSADSQFNVFLLDDLQLFGIDHFFGVFSALNPNIIQNMQVFKNGAESRFGGNIAAVIDIKGKNGAKNKNVYGGGVNFISGDLFSEINIAKNFYAVFGVRRSFTDLFPNFYYDNIFKQTIHNNFQKRFRLGVNLPEKAPDYFFTDFNGKISWQPTDKHIISGIFYIGDDRFKLNAQKTTNDYHYTYEQVDSWGSYAGGINWKHIINPKWFSQMSTYYSTYYINKSNNESIQYFFSPTINNPENTSEEHINNLLSFGLNWKNEYSFTEKTMFEFGVSSIVQGSTNNIKNNVDDDKSPRLRDLIQDGIILSNYFQWNQQWSRKLYSHQGVRLQFHNLSQAYTLEPRLRVQYKLSEKVELKMSQSINNQFFNSLDLNPFDDLNPRTFFISDGDKIPLIRSLSVMLGAKYTYKNWTLDFESYYRKVTGTATFIPNFVDVYPDPFFNGTNDVLGVELLLKKEFYNFTSWLSYSWMDSKSRFSILNNGESFRPNEYTPHQLKLNNLYKYKSFNFSLLFIINSGKPYSVPIAVQRISNPQGIESIRINTKSIPVFHRLDFNVSKKISIGKGKGELGLSIQNVYNHDNIRIRQYSSNESGENIDEPYVIKDIFYLGFTPNVFFNIRF